MKVQFLYSVLQIRKLRHGGVKIMHLIRGRIEAKPFKSRFKSEQSDSRDCDNLTLAFLKGGLLNFNSLTSGILLSLADYPKENKKDEFPVNYVLIDMGLIF